ncbi:S1C family serine protease [Cellulomonas phragmiteti]|nr:trypsin-like peptidase domain-containing protein [Cellulomonas phragmiteti]
MTTTPEPRPAGHTPGPDAHPTQPLPAADATQPLPAPQPPAPAAPPVPQPPARPVDAVPPQHLSPAQQWARYEAAQRAARQPVAAGVAAGVAAEPVPPGHGPGAPAAPGTPGSAPGQVPPGEVPPPGAPGAVTGTPQPRRTSRTWAWIATAAVVGLLVGGGSVASVAFLDLGTSSGDRAASLADVGRSETGQVPVSGSSVENPDWQRVVAAVQDSVVAIDVQTQSGEGQGSGVIIDDDGHVLTNNHVVSGAQGDVRVTLTDGRILEAEVVGTDASTDLAVVRLVDAPDDLQAAALGDSDDVTVGDPVMAVGNPLGLANTVTTGIVSAVDRPVSTQAVGGESAVTNAIQIDAAVNPGNSGGPLFDATGRVIGITSSIATLSQQSGSIGLGFAIPVNLTKNIASQLIADGQAEHAFLGVTLSDGTATADGVTRRGAVVESVSDGSPAAAGGVQAGDVIVAIGGDPVGGAESLTAFVRSMASGDDTTLTVVRDGRTIEVDVTLATRPDDFGQSPQGQDDQGQDDQGQGDQGRQDDQGEDGSGLLPNGMTPQEFWEWLQQQQGQG